jgi:hypothetical protein
MARKKVYESGTIGGERTLAGKVSGRKWFIIRQLRTVADGPQAP